MPYWENWKRFVVSNLKYWTPASFFMLAAGIALRLVYINSPLASDELASASVWAQMPFFKIPSNYQYPITISFTP